MDEPTQPAEPTAEAKQSRGLRSYVVWGFVVVIGYLLSSGPALLVSGKGIWVSPIIHIYSPLWWAYAVTPLRRPLGMYWHVWCPAVYDRNGEISQLP